MTGTQNFGPVRLEPAGESGGASRIILERPERGNALSVEVVEGLLQALDAAEASADDTLILEGTGKGFCGGFDLAGLDGETDASLLYRFVRIELLLQRIAGFPKRTAAYAHGFAFGAGADILASCDLRFATPDCKLSFPGARFGIVLGTRRLSARLGSDAALKLLGAPGPVRAAEAGSLLTGLLTPEEWPSLRADLARATGIEAGVRQALMFNARPAMKADADLSALVRSAARPGLKDRLLAYAATTRVAAGTPGN